MKTLTAVLLGCIYLVSNNNSYAVEVENNSINSINDFQDKITSSMSNIKQDNSITPENNESFSSSNQETTDSDDIKQDNIFD